MDVKLAIIILLVSMTQAKVSKIKPQAVKIEAETLIVPTPLPQSNENCDALADTFCDRRGPKGCGNFREYCAMILNNAHKARGIWVNVEQLWDFAFDMLDRYLPILGLGNSMVPLRRAENQSYEPKDFPYPDNCPPLCPKHLDPVCGGLLYFFERRSYPNECAMKSAACTERKPIIKVKHGNC